jgi:YVTN family beta-propeller protein
LPVGIAFSADGSKAYVANYNGNSVSIIDTATNTVIGTVDNGSYVLDHPTDVTFNAGTLVNVSIPNPLLGGAITIGLPNATNNSTIAYVNTSTYDKIFLINVATGKIAGVVDDSLAPFGTPLSLSSSSSGSVACNFTTNEVSIINPTTNRVSAKVAGAFDAPIRVCITPGNTTAYVTNLGNNTVTVINLLTGLALGVVNDSSFPFHTPYAIDIVNH